MKGFGVPTTDLLGQFDIVEIPKDESNEINGFRLEMADCLGDSSIPIKGLGIPMAYLFCRFGIF